MPKSLRELLENDQQLVVPFAYDAFSAMLVEEAGFQCVGISGSAVAASAFGLPDVGLLSREDVVSQTKRIVEAVNIPVIADADTGYGGPIQVARTVQHFEAAGVAAIFIEDQKDPKLCGHLEGVQVIPKDEMQIKLKAAISAVGDSDFVIIARTDSISVEGLESAVDRISSYVDTGADMGFISGIGSEHDLKQIPVELKGVPLMVVLTEGGKTPMLPPDELGILGYKLIGYSGLAIGTAAHAMRSNLNELNQGGYHTRLSNEVMPLSERNRILDLAKYQSLEDQLLSKPE
tara:strand:+ start:454 stop:1323 length:870 start_codon:yes stop_codon:yes gene_type:complete